VACIELQELQSKFRERIQKNTGDKDNLSSTIAEGKVYWGGKLPEFKLTCN
jgi:hypothetical protein